LIVASLFAFVPDSFPGDLFLHTSATDFLDDTAPTSTTAQFKDSPGINRTAYREIGTWNAAAVTSWTKLTSLNNLRLWIGLKNSDDQGTYFDLRAELRKNGAIIASGETKTIQGVTRNPSNAKEVAVAFGLISEDLFNPGDVLSIKILTKVADSGGHSNAVGLRLYYDAVSRPSRFGAEFITDTTPPTIAAAVNPTPNAAGWHKTDATVSFTCADSTSGVASCPAPVTITTEGVNQPISGTATDLAGNSATASLTVNLDKLAPTVTITSPSNGATVSSTPVNVTGTASDSLSGIATVLCNGSLASLSNPTFACEVPLTNGPNIVIVEATDIASNTGSSSITVTLGEPLEPQNPPVVFGPRIFTQPDEVVSFSVTNPTGTFWLQVSNGEAVPSVGAEPGVVDMLNLVTAGSIKLNGVLIAVPSDFDHDQTLQFGFQKDTTLTSVNTLEVQIEGPAGSFITVEIRAAEPNVTVSNREVDLSGRNEGDFVALSWESEEIATEYIVFRAPSVQGPWQEIFRRPVHAPNGVDVTPDARLMELCYAVEAVNRSGIVIRRYEPICVPKFIQKQKESINPRSFPTVVAARESKNIRRGSPKYPLQLASLNLLAATPAPPINELCFSNPDTEFTDFGSRSKDDIQRFLEEHSSFLRPGIRDVDPNRTPIDPAKVIFDAAQKFRINPEVLLTILEREQTAITTRSRPRDRRLRRIMGWDPRDGEVLLVDKSIQQQIHDGAAQLRRDLDRLSDPNIGQTLAGWKVGRQKQTVDGVLVTPANAPTAAM
jgi:hypothetical protein